MTGTAETAVAPRLTGVLARSTVIAALGGLLAGTVIIPIAGQHVTAQVVALAAENLAPHHLTYYAQDLAATFHAFYRDCRVVSSDPDDAGLTKARLRLVKAAKLVLARTLTLMGVDAPESM